MASNKRATMDEKRDDDLDDDEQAMIKEVGDDDNEEEEIESKTTVLARQPSIITGGVLRYCKLSHFTTGTP